MTYHEQGNALAADGFEIEPNESGDGKIYFSRNDITVILDPDGDTVVIINCLPFTFVQDKQQGRVS